ncbi:MAG: signal peptidase I [Alphaproteobacteria bacterium]
MFFDNNNVTEAVKEAGQKKQKGKDEETLSDFLRTIIMAALAATIIRCFAYEPFNIPSGSMIPTLEVGDYIFVSKFSYGYSAKSSFFGLPIFNGRILFGEGNKPQRGDVVVFKLPSDPSVDYIKRLIGVPGDTVQVKEGRLYVNGVIVERKTEGSRDEKVADATITYQLYQEKLPNKTYAMMERSDDWALDNTQLFTVPSGYYFMMGDNRDNSTDSRVLDHVGFVPEENLVGRAETIFFSLEEGAHFYEFWRWPVTIRFDRIFNKII